MTLGESFVALIVDVGNTRVRVAGWRGGSQDPRQIGCDGAVPRVGTPLVTLGVLDTPSDSDERAFVTVMTELAAEHAQAPMVVSAVVPRVVRLLESVRPEAIVVDHACALPFDLKLPEPAAIGPDRLCNMAAAAAAGCDRILVVDAGTATTFDLLLDGEFVGGLIAPGMALAAACLADKAVRLQDVPFSSCPLEPGRDTAAAMQAGAFHTGIGGVENVISRLCRKYAPLPVVVTGGLGRLLANSGRAFDADWTMRGAAILAGVS